jgi:pentatricopeptide repeat protein
MNIIPNAKSYTFLIKTCARCRKTTEAEKFFKEAQTSVLN